MAVRSELEIWEAHLVAARRHYGAGQFDQALDALSKVPPDRRGDHEYLLLFGACLARLRKKHEALDTFSQLLLAYPDCCEALTWMAALTRDPRNMDESLFYARRAVEVQPEDASGYGVLGTAYLTARQPELASEALEQAVELAPDVAEHRHNLALAYLAQHRHREAIVQLRKGVELAPRDPQNYLVLASTYTLFANVGEAIECLRQGLVRLPHCAPLHTAAAAAFASIRNDDAAEFHHRQAVELSPESRGAYGAWLLNQGRFDEARQTFETLISTNADPAYGYYGLAQARRIDPTRTDEMEHLLRNGRLRPKSEMYLSYALGRATEQASRFQEAMDHYDTANRLAQWIYHSGRPAEAERIATEHDDIVEYFEQLRESAPVGHPSEAPIFIVGMIRSGTTLLDQIVTSHPAVAAAGELRYWGEEIRRLYSLPEFEVSAGLPALVDEYLGYAHLLAGESARFTDKMPLNFAVAGVMHLAMPNARFLHIRRNPVDTCLSIWTTFFGQGPLFAYDKASIVAYYREYLRMMDCWRAAIPRDRLLELDYEDLVGNPEPVIRRVIDFLDLPWSDDCLRHDQNASAIHTPSRWQARQPIFGTSVERWRRYEPWLGEFAALLSETQSPRSGICV